MSNIDRYDYAFDPEADDWPARLLRQVPQGSAVLELGPGAGAMTRVLLARGCKVTVVENDPEAVQALLAMGVEVIESDLECTDWISALGDRRFGVVLACDVLEHLRLPEAVLRALGEVLEPMGKLVVSVPNVAYAGIVAALRHGVFDYADKGLLDRTHVHFFTRRSVEKAMMNSGWVPRLWDANRVPLAQSEFSWCWEELTGDLRQQLLAGWSDFDVYQWMVVAVPSRDGRVWEMADIRAQAERLRLELDALRRVHEPEHASLIEHQKAFAEAKEVIHRFENEISLFKADASRLQQLVETLAAEKRELAANLQSAKDTLAHTQHALHESSLRRRLRKFLRLN